MAGGVEQLAALVVAGLDPAGPVAVDQVPAAEQLAAPRSRRARGGRARPRRGRWPARGRRTARRACGGRARGRRARGGQAGGIDQVPPVAGLYVPTWLTIRQLMILQGADLRVRWLPWLNLRTNSYW